MSRSNVKDAYGTAMSWRPLDYLSLVDVQCAAFSPAESSTATYQLRRAWSVRLGIIQPRVSALMKGAWRDFSADMLLVLAARVGLRPKLKLAT